MMTRPIDLNEQRWQKYQAFQIKSKKNFLRDLSMADGLRTMGELYKFAQKFHFDGSSKKLRMDKVKALGQVHALFGKVH